MDAQTLGQPSAAIAAAQPKEERTRRIAALASNPAGFHYTPYQGRLQRMPVVRVASDMLVYRVENGRLIAELAEHVRKHGQQLADLDASQDSEETQRLLHRLLVAKAADPSGPILQELRREAVQTEPLLITADGVLVNGNRRLAAMRELLAEDPARFAGFAAVDAAVLPQGAAAADMESIEASLQMAPETKLGYGWINRRLKMRRQRDDLGLTTDQLVDAYRLEDAAQLEREIAQLALAEDYLSDFVHQPGAYSYIADAEALFVGLKERLDALPPGLSSLWRTAGFVMIHGRAAVTGPMDRHFPFAPPLPEHLPVWAMRRFAEDREMLGARATAEGQGLDTATRENLLAVFSDANKSDQLATELFALMERLRADFQVERSPQRVLKLLEKVRQSMGDLAPGIVTEQQLRRMRTEATALQAQISELLGEHAQGDGARPGDAGQQAGLAKRLARAFNPR